MHSRWLIEVLSIVSCVCLSGVKLGTAEEIMAHGAPVTVEETLVRMIDRAAVDMNTQLAAATRKLEADGTNEGARFAQTRQAELSAQLQKIRDKYAAQAQPVVFAANESAYQAGLANSARQLAAMGVKDAAEAIGGVSFNLINERTIEAFAKDSTARLNRAADAHAANCRKLFQSFSTGPLSGVAHETATNDILVRGILSGDPREATRELRGLIASAEDLEGTYRQVGAMKIEVGRATMSVRSYAATVVRTRTREATTEAQINRQLAVGIDLVQITGRDSENFCSDFLDMVFVIRGPARDGYRELDEVGKPPFHPNCTKTLTAFHPDLVPAHRIEKARAAEQYFKRVVEGGAREAA